MKLQHISVRGILVVPCCCPRCRHCTWRHSPATWSPMDWPMKHWCLCWRCAGILACIALAVLPASRCCLHWHCADVTASITWASLPLSRWTCHPRCIRVAVSIVNWRPPRHDAIVTHQRTWRCHGLIVVVCGFCCRNRRRSPATWLLCPANLALVVLPALRRRPCPRCTGVLASIALSMPALHWCCHQRRAGLFALLALASPPASQTSICPTKTQLQHVRVHGVVVVVIVLTRGLITVPGIIPR
jgi:hypothetical protein